MQRKRNGTVLAGAVIAAGLVLAACGTPATEAPTGAPVPTTAPAEKTATPAMAPAAGPTAEPEVGVPVIESPAPGDPAAVADYNTYILGGPGLNYVVYGAFLGGEAAKVVGRSDDSSWWAIGVPPAPGGTGWVSAAWVTVTDVDGVPVLAAPPPPSTTAMVPPGPGDPQATVLVNTYVRSGPGETFPAYGIAPSGATARVIGKSADGAWWVVRVNPENIGAGYGWVSASAVQASNADGVPVIEAPSTPVVIPPPAPPAGAATATALDYLYVRSGAGTCYAPYGVVAPGAAGEVSGKSADGQWWQVKIPTEVAASGIGWVSGSYVTTANTESVPAAESPPCTSVPTPAAAPYACSLASQDPEDYAVMAPEAAFTMAWEIRNGSGAAWTDAVLEFVKSGSGGSFHTGSDSIDIGDVAANSNYTTSVPAMAPSTSGDYGELWEIHSGGEPVCEFWMIITVE